MFRRSLVFLLEIGAVGIVVVSAVLFWASYYVDTPEFRDRFVRVIEQLTGQPVTLKGEFNIALYPTISLEILGLVVDSDDDSKDAPLVEFDELRVSARLMPLLQRQIELRTIVVEGMTVHIVRSPKGKINWQSVIDRQSILFASSNGSENQIAGISLAGLEIVNASFSFADQMEGDSFTLSGVDLRTGSIVPGEDVPFSARSNFAWKNGGITSQLILKGLVESHDGAHVRLKGANLYASVAGDFLPQGANPGEITASIDIDWDDKQLSLEDVQIRLLGLRAMGTLKTGDLSGKLSATGNVAIQQFVPSEVIQRYFPNAPVASVDGLKSGAYSSDFQVDESGVRLSQIQTSLDDLNVQGEVSLTRYNSPSLELNLRGTKVNLDRYLPLFETGTPFIWDDFSLGFWGSLRGQGVVHAESFTVLGKTLSDIRLALDANDSRIAANASARLDGVEDLKGKAEFRFGKNIEKHLPTFGGMLELSGKSPVDGFPFLSADKFSIGGEGRALLKIDVAEMDCSPSERSIGILRYLSGDVSFLLGEGRSLYGTADTKHILSYSTLECSLAVSPTDLKAQDSFGLDTNISIRGQGDERFGTFAISSQGPLVTAVDKFHVRSDGIRIKTSLSGKLFTNQLSRLTANGLVGFDSDLYNLDITDATIRTLETTVKGEAKFVQLDKAFKGTGKLSIPNANARRIIFLLTKYGLRTNDPEALKSVKLDSNFIVDERGFTFSELEGKLDGMSLNAHVVGHGLKHPKLIFSLSAGKFDLDRYLPPSKNPTLQEAREGRDPKKSDPVDLPLVFLQWLRLSGKAWFEEFKLAKVRANGLSANINTENGDIQIADGVGKVHGGDLTANWTGKVSKKSLSTHLKLHVEDMQAGPLLIDMADREYLRGETDVDFDLISFGRTDDDIVKNLDGKAWARVRNGSFKFTGYDLPNPKSNDLNQELKTYGKRKEVERRTTFQKASGYFAVKNGVFIVNKFRVEAPPVLQAYGEGWFSLPANSIDLAIRNDFVVVPSVTIHLKGKLSDPSVSVPTGEILDKTVRNILSLPEKSFNFLRDLFQ